MNYNELLQQPEWKLKRLEVLIRDLRSCRNCGSQSNLHVHHRQYHYLDSGEKVKPWEYNSKYLITLCSTCHSHGHQEFKVPSFNLNKKQIQTTQNHLETQLWAY